MHQQGCYLAARAVRKGKYDAVLAIRSPCQGLFGFPLGLALRLLGSGRPRRSRLLPVLSMVNRILVTPSTVARARRRLVMPAGRVVVVERQTSQADENPSWPSPPRLIRTRWARSALALEAIRPRIVFALSERPTSSGPRGRWVHLVEQEGVVEAAARMHRITTEQMQATMVLRA